MKTDTYADLSNVSRPNAFTETGRWHDCRDETTPRVPAAFRHLLWSQHVDSSNLRE